MLYGLPVAPSQVQRLASLARELGPDSISVLADHPAQVSALRTYRDLAGHAASVFVKIDAGYHRAGVVVGGAELDELLTSIDVAEGDGRLGLCGFYCHAGQSYGVGDASAAAKLLADELQCLMQATRAFRIRRGRHHARPLTLSVGATPTATAIQHFIQTDQGQAPGRDLPSQAMQDSLRFLEAARTDGHRVEVHAGVYALLDLQQMATHARDLAYADLALTVLAEVTSKYARRGKGGRPEVLLAAGSLALGREPCQAYAGWGVVSDWNTDRSAGPARPGRSGWKVDRISQEHGILVQSAHDTVAAQLDVGQKVRVWPNHACIAGAGFGWYLVVDSSREGREDEIVDVWVRWSGW